MPQRGIPVNSYVFMTDSDSDLPYSFVDQYDLKMVYMPYIVDGVEYFYGLLRVPEGYS